MTNISFTEMLETVNYRIRNGWDSVKAITTPVKGR